MRYLLCLLLLGNLCAADADIVPPTIRAAREKMQDASRPYLEELQAFARTLDLDPIPTHLSDDPRKSEVDAVRPMREANRILAEWRNSLFNKTSGLCVIKGTDVVEQARQLDAVLFGLTANSGGPDGGKTIMEIYKKYKGDPAKAAGTSKHEVDKPKLRAVLADGTVIEQ